MRTLLLALILATTPALAQNQNPWMQNWTQPLMDQKLYGTDAAYLMMQQRALNIQQQQVAQQQQLNNMLQQQMPPVQVFPIPQHLQPQPQPVRCFTTQGVFGAQTICR